MQAVRLGDGAYRVVGEMRGHFQADEAVGTRGAVENRTQDVTGSADVSRGQILVDFLDRSARQRVEPDLLIVVAALRNRLVEDGRVGSDAAQPFLTHSARQTTVVDHPPREIVEPVTLAIVRET